MTNGDVTWIANVRCGIRDRVLRDPYVHGNPLDRRRPGAWARLSDSAVRICQRR